MSLENRIIKDNITEIEVEGATNYLKNNKNPGIDSIPAEFVKSYKYTLSSDITLVLNYIIGLCDFPKAWAEGLRSSVFKSGSRLDTDNYRGITILPIIEKIFEIIVYRRLSFANDAFDKKKTNTTGVSSLAVEQLTIYYFAGSSKATTKYWVNPSGLFCRLHQSI